MAVHKFLQQISVVKTQSLNHKEKEMSGCFLVDIKERAKVSGCHVDGNKKTIREMLMSG